MGSDGINSLRSNSPQVWTEPNLLCADVAAGETAAREMLASSFQLGATSFPEMLLSGKVPPRLFPMPTASNQSTPRVLPFSTMQLHHPTRHQKQAMVAGSLALANS